MIKIANIQLNSQDDIDTNLNIISRAVHTAASQDARFIVLPENACVMGSQKTLAKRTDEIVEYYQYLSQSTQTAILAGTLPYSTRPDGSLIDGKFRQSSLLFDTKGQIVARYDKIHLFRAYVTDGVGAYDEGLTFEAGNQPTIGVLDIDGKILRVGMAICFDVRFPRLFQSLRQMGADIITVPSAFTHTTGQAHWQTLLQARALDSQCLIVGAAQGGTHHFYHKETPHERQTWGHAMMVDANGQILTTTAQSDCGTDGFIATYAVFDQHQQQQIRENMPIFNCHKLA